MSKYLAHITIFQEVATPAEFGELVASLSKSHHVSRAALDSTSEYAGAILGAGAGAGQINAQVAPQASTATTPAAEANEGKTPRTRAKKTEPATTGNPGSGSESAIGQTASEKPAETGSASPQASSPAATESATPPADAAKAGAVTVEQLRAKASEKIAADTANRAKVHAVIKEFSSDKDSPAMSKIPADQCAAALAKLEAL